MPSSEPRAGDSDEDPLFVAELVHVRDDYRALRHTAYRLRVFALLRQLAAAEPATVWAQMQTLVTVAAAGGTDGLQTVVLAYADALAHTAYADDVASLLAASADSLTMRMKGVPLNVLQPLGRASTRVVVNARGDAANAMLDALLDQPSVQDLDELLDNAGLQDDLCGLPSSRDVIGASEVLGEADAKRQQACEEIANGGMGGAAGLMVGMAADPCFNVDISGARDAFGENADDYGDDDRMADLEACVDSFDKRGSQIAGSGMMLGGPGALVVFELIDSLTDKGGKSEAKSLVTTAVEKGIDSATELAKIALQAYVTHLGNEAAYKLELQKQSDALGQQIASLGAEITALQGEVARLGGEIGALQAQIDQFDENGMTRRPDGTYSNTNSAGKTKEQLEQEKAAKEKEKEEKEKEQKDKENEKKQKEAVKKVVDKQKDDAEGGLEPEMDPACERAMLGGKDWPTLKLGEDWASAEKRREPVTNPNPDAPPTGEPEDLLGLASCGPDATSSGTACIGLAHCLEGESCGCSDEIGAEPHSPAEAAALFDSLVQGCSLTRCEDGEPAVRGGVCECTEYGASTDLPPLPEPPIARGVVEAFFVQSDEMSQYEGDSSIGYAIDQIVRP